MPKVPAAWNYEFSSIARRWLKGIKEKALLQKIGAVIDEVVVAPLAGNEKCEDLKGVLGKSFHYSGVAYRIAYSLDSKKQLVRILFVGPRENFYKELKRYLQS